MDATRSGQHYRSLQGHSSTSWIGIAQSNSGSVTRSVNASTRSSMCELRRPNVDKEMRRVRPVLDPRLQRGGSDYNLVKGRISTDWAKSSISQESLVVLANQRRLPQQIATT